VFTAQSKKYYYCRDAVCEFVFRRGCVPLNPFRAFGYFLGDRVDRTAVREGNNNLIQRSDELWVFGETLANGVLFEVLYARQLEKPVRFYTIGTRADEIGSISPDRLRFEPELRRLKLSRVELLQLATGISLPEAKVVSLFDSPERERTGDIDHARDETA
jgi:hypothetical protein